jgi:GR25 family glycosyltransferase involved in LPS biosynthesis
MSHLTHMIKVISLKSSSYRRKTFKEKNKHIAFEFFDAVDGKLLKHDSEITHLFDKNLPYTDGAIGCALSHYQLWNMSIENNEVLTIAEDDAIFRYDFMEKKSQMIQAIKDWDIILWGWNFDSILALNVMPQISPAVMVFDQGMLRRFLDKFQNLMEPTYPLRLDKCFGTPSYSISPKGAKKLKSLCFPLQNFNLFFPLLNRSLPNNGIDIALNRVYAETQAYVSFPPLVVTENDHRISTVQT